jgi:STE24 endopeptidase
LFCVAPAIVLILLRDVLSLTLPPMLNQIAWLRQRPTYVEALVSLPSLGLILVLGPEILRRILQTETMPDCPLRRRLESTCRQNRVGLRNVLTWRTRHQMGNAAVMGFIPQVRYILLSDLLLETMSDQQIEAVFAHEVGHVKHRHLWWLLLTLAATLLALAGPGQLVADELAKLQQRIWLPEGVQLSLLLGAGLAIFALVFGYISRRFERQADVFAARTMQIQAAPAAIVSVGAASEDTSSTSSAVIDDAGPSLRTAIRSHVGQSGAQIFCSALERVANVNNIPIAARSWCHGSIARRMRFVRELSEHPLRTARFDRSMARLYLALALGLCVFAGWTMLATQ